MSESDDPKNEGHTKEWQDRARVVLDTKKAAATEASQKQSPAPQEDEDVEEKRERLEKKGKDDRVY